MLTHHREKSPTLVSNFELRGRIEELIAEGELEE